VFIRINQSYYFKKSFKNYEQPEQKGEFLSLISAAYRDLEKYRIAIKYEEIALNKYYKDEQKILDSKENIASCYYCLSEFKKALAIYKELSENDTVDKAKKYMQLADCQYQLGQIREMKENIQKASSLGSNDPKTNEIITNALENIKNKKGLYDKKTFNESDEL